MHVVTVKAVDEVVDEVFPDIEAMHACTMYGQRWEVCNQLLAEAMVSV